MNTINLVKRMLHGFNPAGSASGSAKATLQPSVTLDPHPSNEECVNELEEDLPVEVLLHDDLVDVPTTLYCLLRGCLVLKGLVY